MNPYTYPNCKPMSPPSPTDLFRSQLMEKGLRLSDTFCYFTEANQNGRQSQLNFWAIYSLYKKSTEVLRPKEDSKNFENFLRPLFGIRIQDFCPELMSEFLSFSDHQASADGFEEMRSIFRWYSDTYDPSFVAPIMEPQ